jgi:hypothetical protein
VSTWDFQRKLFLLPTRSLLLAQRDATVRRNAQSVLLSVVETVVVSDVEVEHLDHKSTLSLLVQKGLEQWKEYYQ